MIEMLNISTKTLKRNLHYEHNKIHENQKVSLFNTLNLKVGEFSGPKRNTSKTGVLFNFI